MHQCAANWFARKKMQIEANVQLQRARAFLPHSGAPYLEAWLLWTESTIQQSTGNLEATEEHVSLAVELFAGINPFDAVLANIDLVDLLISMGRIEEARSEFHDLQQRYLWGTERLGMLAPLEQESEELSSRTSGAQKSRFRPTTQVFSRINGLITRTTRRIRQRGGGRTCYSDMGTGKRQ